MPWGINNTNGGQGGYFGRSQAGQQQSGQFAGRQQAFEGQRQAGQFAGRQQAWQVANPFAPLMFGSNRSRQDAQYTQQQAVPQGGRQAGALTMRQPNSYAQQQPSFSGRQAGPLTRGQTAAYAQQQAAPSMGQQMGSYTQPAQLADGVQIQPINASALSMLQGMGEKQPAQIRTVNLTEPDDKKEPEGALLDSLREIIQDERNSALFYAYMAEKAPNADYADHLRREGVTCGERVNKLSRLYSDNARENFTPAEEEINRDVDYNTGVSWAVAVESDALKKYGALYENAPDEKFARMIFAQVCGKISHIVTLILIMRNMS